ncbi:Cysteamine dioxygenase [Bertholletia excelsa]
MGIEKIPPSRKGKESWQLPSQANGKSRKNRRRQRKVSSVQKLFEICKEVFAAGGPGIVPSAGDVELIKSVLDGMTEADVGLNKYLPFFSRRTPDGLPIITYIHLYDCDKFSIGIFCLPPSSVIPLHNHPGMTVFSKLLFGTMHIKSYDWTVPAVDVTSGVVKAPAGVRLAKLKVDADFTAPCNTSILYPADGGNMHCFTALTPCAVLDVLGPPYCDPQGRHCQYYRDLPFSSFSDERVKLPEEEVELHAWLQEREKPDGFIVVGGPYSGPKIADK